MTDEYKTFIAFLEENVKSNNDLDMVIYNIGIVQRIAEQFSQFYNQKIKNEEKEYDLIDYEIDFENQCNEKVHLALGLGDSSTLFIECEILDETNLFDIHVNKQRIAALTLEDMHDL